MHMAHVSTVHARTVAYDETPADLSRASWILPAIGSAILAIAWAIYLVPVVVGIVETIG
jgi:hypothetical protein